MRKPMMAGNWKMNKTVAEAKELAQAIQAEVATVEAVDRVLCPPFVCLPAVQDALANSSIAVGAQNMHWAASGAYTGEVSGAMLQGLAQYVIIGHSERRQYFGETDESVNQKVKAALAHSLIPIVCVGESLEQNEGKQTAAVVTLQVQDALDGVSAEQVQTLVIAYEPIWAIGTGKAATPQQANATCGVVRGVVAHMFDDAVAQATRVLYGGSTNDKNIADIMQQPEIDGALIGGAALKAESYCAMVQTTAQLYA